MKNSGWFNDDGTVTILLTQGRMARVSLSSLPVLSPYKWCAYKAGRGRWYARTSTGVRDGKRQFIDMHRLLVSPPAGLLVDHIDNDGLNNTDSNLRVCTHTQNNWNRHLTVGMSQFKGVHFVPQRGKFRAMIRVDGKLKHLGYFVDEGAAAQAYDIAARKYYGDFATQNLPAR